MWHLRMQHERITENTASEVDKNAHNAPHTHTGEDNHRNEQSSGEERERGV